jgi:hypothetical protein
MKFGEFLHLKDDLSFNISLIAGFTIAILLLCFDLLHCIFIENYQGSWVYASGLLFVLLLYFAVWRNYLSIRKII